MTLDQYRIIFDRSAAAIMLVNAQEQIISWNKFAENMLGMQEEDLELRPVSSLYPSTEWARIRAMDIRSKGQQDHLETRMIRKNGKEIDVDISITVLKDENNQVTGSIGIIRDISDRKIAERDLLAAHRMKVDFLAMVSHELRTPLTAIKGSIGIIVDGATGELNEEQKDFMNTAQRNVDRLEILINNVLDYQRLESGGIEFKLLPGDINDIAVLVKNDMELLAQKKGLALHIYQASQLPSVLIDKERFKRAIKNLVDNAIKFTDKGQVDIVTSIEGNQVCLAIKDTGIGIKPEDREHLFERFSQVSAGHGRQTGSLGLGLVIARKIISHHGGDIWIQSSFGQGTTFSVYLPIHKGT